MRVTTDFETLRYAAEQYIANECPEDFTLLASIVEDSLGLAGRTEIAVPVHSLMYLLKVWTLAATVVHGPYPQNGATIELGKLLRSVQSTYRDAKGTSPANGLSAEDAIRRGRGE